MTAASAMAMLAAGAALPAAAAERCTCRARLRRRRPRSIALPRCCSASCPRRLPATAPRARSTAGRWRAGWTIMRPPRWRATAPRSTQAAVILAQCGMRGDGRGGAVPARCGPRGRRDRHPHDPDQIRAFQPVRFRRPHAIRHHAGGGAAHRHARHDDDPAVARHAGGGRCVVREAGGLGQGLRCGHREAALRRVARRPSARSVLSAEEPADHRCADRRRGGAPAAVDRSRRAHAARRASRRSCATGRSRAPWRRL